MRELFKESLKILNNNIIVVIPLIIFVKIIDLYSLYSRMYTDTMGKFLLASITMLFMAGVFFAGWFYMVKKAIALSEQLFVIGEDNKAMTLVKSIPEGIGKYFLSFVGMHLTFMLVQLAATPIVFYLGRVLIGKPDISVLQKIQMLANNSDVSVFVDSLTPEQLIFFGKWSLLLMIITSFIMFVLMLWIPEIIYKNHNPVVALVSSVFKIFKDFLNSFGLFILLWLIGFVLLFINTFSIINPVTYLVMSVVMFYFLAYFSIVVFLYYKRKYVDEK